MIRIGQIVNGRYRILRLLGRGGMSAVYLAEDLRLSSQWALKEIPKSIKGRDNSLYIQSAVSEANMMKSLSHPGIARIVDRMEDEDAIYIVEDYVPGVSLKAFLHGRADLTEARLLDWALQVCEILRYLHSRKPPIIYRDLKPDNLILTESGHLRLVDFGTARRYNPSGNRDTEYLGTVPYAAPEQYEENGCQTDPRTDIYGLGMTLHHLAGSVQDLSPGFRRVIDRCIQADPARRYAGAEKLRRDLLRLYAGRSGSGFRRIYGYLAAFLAGIGMILGLIFSGGHQEESRMDRILHMVDEVQADQCFEREEEEQLLQVIMPNLSELQQEQKFGQLAYRIGMLYWYEYDYGSDPFTGIMASEEWFRMAKEDYLLADAYDSIARFLTHTFLQREEWMQQEDPEQVRILPGEYRKCFAQLYYLIHHIPQEDSVPWHYAKFCRITERILNSGKVHFLKDGISEEDFQEMYEIVSQAGKELP